MSALPDVISKQDCIRSLTELGFAPVWELNGHTLLVRHGSIVNVPSHALLDEETVRGILRSASVSSGEFGDVLASLELKRFAESFEDD